jgi:hypothetical protein
VKKLAVGARSDYPATMPWPIVEVDSGKVIAWAKDEWTAMGIVDACNRTHGYSASPESSEGDGEEPTGTPEHGPEAR